MKDRVYGSSHRDNSINSMSNRIFTKSDCMSWLDGLEDESVNLWLIDPPYNVLTGNMKNKNGAALFHSRYTAKVSPNESDFEKELVTPQQQANNEGLEKILMYLPHEQNRVDDAENLFGNDYGSDDDLFTIIGNSDN